MSSSKDDIAVVSAHHRTKGKRRKIPPNIPFVPIDGILFHNEENVHKWKYVVQHCITNEKVMSDQAVSCLEIMELVYHASLMRTVINLGSFYPQLICELIVNFPTQFNDPSNQTSRRFIFEVPVFIFLQPLSMPIWVVMSLHPSENLILTLQTLMWS